jgi:hypothetical protein
MLIAYVTEPMNLIFARKERCGNAMHWCVSPSLCQISRISVSNEKVKDQRSRLTTNLVVKSASRIQVLKELCVRLATPEAHIRNLKVTPDCHPVQMGLSESKV